MFDYENLWREISFCQLILLFRIATLLSLSSSLVYSIQKMTGFLDLLAASFYSLFQISNLTTDLNYKLLILPPSYFRTSSSYPNFPTSLLHFFFIRIIYNNNMRSTSKRSRTTEGANQS